MKNARGTSACSTWQFGAVKRDQIVLATVITQLNEFKRCRRHMESMSSCRSSKEFITYMRNFIVNQTLLM